MVGRRPLDAYQTQAKVTEELLKHIWLDGRVLEPCVGEGRMAEVLRRDRGVAVVTNDINPEYHTDFISDAGDPCSPIWHGLRAPYDWVVTNPPFTDVHRILPLAWEHCQIGVAFLLRLSYLEPARDRAVWLEAHKSFMSHLIIFNPRPSFTGDGNTDSVTAAWMVWRRAHRGGLQIEFAAEWKK